MLKLQTRLTTVIFATTCAILLLGSVSTTASGQKTVTVMAGSSETISSQLYGVNGQQRNDQPWDQPGNTNPAAFNSALGSLNLSILRFPAGTGANYWDWSVGDFDGYYVNVKSNYQSKLTELQNELMNAGSQARVDFVLNMLTDAQNCTIADFMNGTSGTCLTPTPSSPNLTYQIQMLQGANQMNVSVPYVELGNEFWNVGCNTDVYPSGSGGLDQGGYNYATAIVNGNWVSQIKNTDPGVKIAAIANYQPPQLTGDNRRMEWNQSFFTASPLPSVDGLTIHIYRNSNLSQLLNPPSTTLPFNGKGIRGDVVKTMLAMPFHMQDDLAQNYLNDSLYNVNGQNKQQLQPSSSYEPSIWVTEYNMKEPAFAVNGSWAHGLAVAAMGLKFLDNIVQPNTCQPTCTARITMAIQHEALGSAYFGEIFDSNEGFGSSSSGSQTPPVPLCAGAAASGNPPVVPAKDISTFQNQLTAVGLTQEQLNLASSGQTSATKLSFSQNLQMIDDPSWPTQYIYPSLYGWEFSGSSSTQIIILNLAGVSQTVDVNSLAKNGGTYSQIYGDPGAYYQGYDGSTYEASYEDSNGPGGAAEAVSDPLTVTNNKTLTPSSLLLPAYSITRIIKK